MTRKEKRLARIAHHEAGHAVITVWQGMSFDTVSIEQEGPVLGRVSGYRQPEASTLVVCPTCNTKHRDYGTYKSCADCDEQTWTENLLLVALAGPEAERRFTGVSRSKQVGKDILAGFHRQESDYWRVYDLSKRFHGFRPKSSPFLSSSEGMIVEAHVGYMVKRVQWIFADRNNAGWKAVDRLAAALESTKVLDFNGVLAIINPILYPGALDERNAAA